MQGAAGRTSELPLEPGRAPGCAPGLRLWAGHEQIRRYRKRYDPDTEEDVARHELRFGCVDVRLRAVRFARVEIALLRQSRQRKVREARKARDGNTAEDYDARRYRA